jgi:hypothetical protein
MKRIIQFNYLVLALLFTFSACNEDTPDINDPGVEKRLKTITTTTVDGVFIIQNFSYENDKVVNFNGYSIYETSGDTFYFNYDFSYVGNTVEIINSLKDQYTGGIWEVFTKYVCEIDANNNVVSYEEFEFEDGAYELEFNTEYDYLSSGQLKSSIDTRSINGARFEVIFDFNTNNLLQTQNIDDYDGDTSSHTYTNDGINVVNSSKIIDTDGYYYERQENFSYDSNNRLIRDSYKVCDSLLSFPDWIVRESLSFISDYSYDVDGLLSSIIFNVEDFGYDFGTTNTFEYEAGYGNIQTFWFLLNPYDDIASFSYNFTLHKALNKGLATLQ